MKLVPLSPSREVREGLADVISIHEMLTNQILLSTLRDSSNSLASVCKTNNTGAVLGLQIKQSVS